MKQSVLLITPPFTQLNTPYPATAYIKGFLNTQNIPSFQVDLGIEVILKVFTKEKLNEVFNHFDESLNYSDNIKRIYRLKDHYLNSIDAVIEFLQGKNPTLAHSICSRNFLPEAGRFINLEDLDWSFGSIGTQDKAKHLATLYLEDLSDFIVSTTDEHFGFNRYAEKLARSAYSFDELNNELKEPLRFFDSVTLELLEEKLTELKPKLVVLTAPFPGNIYSAFRCGQYVKKHHSTVKIAFGGGFANTELRSLKDERVFNYFDFISLDDGEAPLLQIIRLINGECQEADLKRTFIRENNEVVYYNNQTIHDFKLKDVGTPDYSDLPLNDYISVIEVTNPMHRLWSDGRWNKLTFAHGCYWGKCTFCDISLDYIKIYEANSAKLLVDRVEEIIKQTKTTGFHFVDEAAPPSLMKEFAIEILKRNIQITWWTNIRFEKNFTNDLCQLLAKSGCIAVSGGLEVASDRLLKLIDKGVTVEQVAKVTSDFTNAGIMVHAYLMYGYPTQTIQETIDSLEMVRQLMETGCIQSGFWHQFAMTAHSPVGLEPEKYNSTVTSPIGTFANNDLIYEEKNGIDHGQFHLGLKTSLYNYMNGVGYEMPLQEWFDFQIPKTKVPINYIQRAIEKPSKKDLKSHSRIIWMNDIPKYKIVERIKKGKLKSQHLFVFSTLTEEINLILNEKWSNWLIEILSISHIQSNQKTTLSHWEKSFNENTLGDFNSFLESSTFEKLRDEGLMVL